MKIRHNNRTKLNVDKKLQLKHLQLSGYSCNHWEKGKISVKTLLSYHLSYFHPRLQTLETYCARPLSEESSEIYFKELILVCYKSYWKVPITSNFLKLQIYCKQ
jgi:hypothetical protein